VGHLSVEQVSVELAPAATHLSDLLIELDIDDKLKDQEEGALAVEVFVVCLEQDGVHSILLPLVELPDVLVTLVVDGIHLDSVYNELLLC
jgi:hypothetical protein